MNLKELLKEELTDIPTTNQLFHYTNAKALSKILDSGFIKSNDNYPSKSIDNGKKISEISTMRPTKENELKSLKKTSPYVYSKKMEDISMNIGNIKFIIFKDRITKGVRGAKIKTIAELPKGEKETIDRLRKEIIKAFEEKGYKDIGKDIKHLIDAKDAITQAVAFGFLEGKYKNARVFVKLHELDRSLRYLKGYLKPENKEGEERIVFNKKDGTLPLNYNLMRIELLPGSVSEIESVLGYEFIRNIKKYNNLFVKNNSYNKLITEINEKLKGTGKDFEDFK